MMNYFIFFMVIIGILFFIVFRQLISIRSEHRAAKNVVFTELWRFKEQIFRLYLENEYNLKPGSIIKMNSPNNIFYWATKLGLDEDETKTLENSVLIVGHLGQNLLELILPGHPDHIIYSGSIRQFLEHFEVKKFNFLDVSEKTEITDNLKVTNRVKEITEKIKQGQFKYFDV